MFVNDEASPIFKISANVSFSCSKISSTSSMAMNLHWERSKFLRWDRLTNDFGIATRISPGSCFSLSNRPTVNLRVYDFFVSPNLLYCPRIRWIWSWRMFVCTRMTPWGLKTSFGKTLPLKFLSSALGRPGFTEFIMGTKNAIVLPEPLDRKSTRLNSSH